MASLRELQHAFAAALRDPAAPCAVQPATNLAVYRHNSEHQFRNALGISFPVLRRRVGEDYFRQLAFHYRQRFPSRSGDLHWAGREFPAFLAGHLQATDYAWLTELARMEWAREAASVAEVKDALGVAALTQFAADELEHLVFTLQPSLHLQAAEFPLYSLWLANQVDNAPPVDQSLGPEQFMVLSRYEGVEVRRLDAPLFSYLSALAKGAPLGAATTAAGLDESGLLAALQFMFTESLVCGITR